MADTARNKELVRRLYEIGLNRGDESIADALVADDFTNESGFTDVKGPEAFKTTIRRMRSAFPDLEYSLEEIIAEGDTVAVRWTMLGTHLGEIFGIGPTGRRVRHQAMAFLRLRDGKVVQRHGIVDQLGLLRQLGRGPRGDQPQDAAPATVAEHS